MAAAHPGQFNTYIPNTKATNHLVVDFARNPKEFALAQYVQYVNVKQNVGRYIEMTIEQAGRVLNANLSDRLWPDGADAPEGAGNAEQFEFKPYISYRYAYPFRLGELAVEQAEWDVMGQNQRINMQAAMTARTVKVIALAQATGTYPTGNTSAVSSISGVTGKHDVSTTARKDIARSLHYAADVIRKNTLGAVKPSDLVYVVSPGYARKVAVCQEIVDHIKGSPDAREEIEKGLGPNSQYGLPSTLYGYPVRVEDTVKVTTRKGASSVTRSYVMDDAKPFMCARPGDLVGLEGSPSFSTFSLMLKEDLTVWTKHDTDNRVHKGRIVDDFGAVATAPMTGFLFTAAVD